MWYCKSNEQHTIPIIQKTKWSNKRLGFFVAVTYNSKMKLSCFFVKKSGEEPLNTSIPPVIQPENNPHSLGVPREPCEISDNLQATALREQLEAADALLYMEPRVPLDQDAMEIESDDAVAINITGEFGVNRINDVIEHGIAITPGGDPAPSVPSPRRNPLRNARHQGNFMYLGGSDEGPFLKLRAPPTPSLLNSTSSEDEDELKVSLTYSYPCDEDEPSGSGDAVQLVSSPKKGPMPDRMSKEKWIKLCGQPLKEFYEESGKAFTLVHDNAAYYANHHVDNFIKNNFKDFIKTGRKAQNGSRPAGGFPPYSPDFNVAELVINHIKSNAMLELYDVPAKELGGDRLVEVLTRSCNQIPQETLQKWFKHVWNNMQWSKEAGGDYAKKSISEEHSGESSLFL